MYASDGLSDRLAPTAQRFCFFAVCVFAALLLAACGSTSSGTSPIGSGGGRDAPPASDESAGGDGSSNGSIPGSGNPDHFQPGTLTAGDLDDLLNAPLYADYVSDFLQNNPDASSLYVSVHEAVVIDVVGSEGAPYPFAKVSVVDNDEVLFTRATPTDGKVRLYPSIDELPETFEIRATNAAEDVQVTKTVTLSQLEDDRTIELTLPMLPQPVDKLDLQLVIDTTGSMGDELDYLQEELTSIVGSIANNNPGIHIRLGLVLYRDIGDEYVTRDFPFTDDVAEFQATLNAQTHDGGGDYPEAMDRALEVAMTFAWRDDAVKALLLVADAPPHNHKLQATWEAALAAREQQIHIVPLAASGSGLLTEFIMRGMAVLTNSRYLFLTDDSGYGNPHDEPTTECYVVTRLDHLVIRVIDSLLQGERIEPAEEQIVRTEGNYNSGVCDPWEQGSQ